MSVIVQDDKGKLLLLSKGADRSVSCLNQSIRDIRID